MNVLCVLGSPRKKGNSATIARKFLDVAEERGATIETCRLNELAFKPCQACYACKTKLEHCALEDDLTPVLEAFVKSDVVVVATPVYYGDVSAQTKAFIDRTFSLLKPDFITNPEPVRFAPGKKMLWIITQQAPAEFHGDIYDRYGAAFRDYGKCEIHLIRGTEVEEPGEVARRPDVMAQAEEMARKLIPAS